MERYNKHIKSFASCAVMYAFSRVMETVADTPEMYPEIDNIDAVVQVLRIRIYWNVTIGASHCKEIFVAIVLDNKKALLNTRLHGT